MKVLDTERLVLRRVTLDDAEFILELVNEPAFHQNIGDRGVRTLEDARAYVETRYLAPYAADGFGMYLMESKASGEPIGTCGLVDRPGLEGIDIGFALHSAFWSRGYAVEAAAAVLEYARSSLGIQRVVAITNPDNLGSQAVLRKIGLGYERMVRLDEDGPEIQLYSIELTPDPAAGVD